MNYKKMWLRLKKHFESRNQTIWGISEILLIIKEIEDGLWDFLDKEKKK